MNIAERLATTPELRDTSTWPMPSEHLMDDEGLATFHVRVGAISAYLDGTSFSRISTRFGLSKSQIYRMLDRCLTVKKDGDIHGFFALMPGYPISRYSRRAPITENGGGSGKAGAFRQLLEQHEELKAYVERMAIRLSARPARAIVKAIRTEFLKKCAKLKAPNEYPFTTEDQCAKSLGTYVKGFLESYFLAQPRIDGDGGSPRQGLTAQPSLAPHLRPYEEAEHDGHNADFYFVIKALGLRDEWIYSTPMRLWLLLLVDRASRAILGYSYRLGGTNYSAIAVMRSFSHALTKWTPKELTVPHLAYKVGAGFPSGVCALGHGRLVDLVCFDNGLANRAGITTRTLVRHLGATLNFGRAGEPIARPFVERLNQTLETLGFRRLPSGFDPRGPAEERERAIKAASAHAMTIDELEQVIDVVLANYNSDPHSALVNRSPNQFISMWDERNVAPIRRASDPDAIARRMLRLEVIKVIRGGGKTHRAPYVEYSYARYTNDILSKMTVWNGLRIRLTMDIDGDIRLIRGHVINGLQEIDIGILHAEPPWHLTPHTLQQRQLIYREAKISKIVVPPGSDLVQAFKALKTREAVARKSAANQLVKAGSLKPPTKAPGPQRDARARVPTKDWIKLKP
ncbi:hypothetical protein [Dyella sp. Tek66A03]|uniref:hypothetical protein n=1 Tax=Dyella sp. Tek66A03 TaxID=3458298 RepID=UPI00403E9B7F